MVMVIAFLYRIFFGKFSPEFDIVAAVYNHEDASRLLKFVSILKFNLSVRNIFYIANHRDVLPILYRETNAFVFEGTNQDAEWSAYQQGVTASSSQGIAPGGLIVMNDTVTTHRSFTIIRYIKFLNFFRKRRKSVQMAGFCDGDSGSGFEIFDRPVGPWVSSYLFYLSPELIDILNANLMSRHDLVDEWFFSCDLKRIFPNWINEPFKDHLQNWLFKGGWYGSQTLSDANFEKFKRKLKSILYETDLSAEVITCGVLNDMMPKKTIARYANDKIENFYKRKLPRLVRMLIVKILFVN